MINNSYFLFDEWKNSMFAKKLSLLLIWKLHETLSCIKYIFLSANYPSCLSEALKAPEESNSKKKKKKEKRRNCLIYIYLFFQGDNSWIIKREN